MDLIGWFVEALRRPDGALERYPRPDHLTTVHRRAIEALAQERRGVTLGEEDLAVLLRAVLRTESRGPRRWKTGQPQVVPDGLAARLSPDTLRRASLVNRGPRPNGVALVALPWAPSWLPDVSPGSSPEDPLHEDQPRRSDQQVAGDPFLRHAGLRLYQSSAQRDAVRTVLAAPPGSTVIVNLPTGSGKTHCALVPALLPPDETGLIGVTPIVVPTVALALDLERRCAHLVDHPTAYRGDDDDIVKETIRRRCAEGTQGPLFLAPEALVGTMRGPLLDAAKAGLLRYLVVDEAHMMTAWGDDFRPEFQRIASVRAQLLKKAGSRPFVTILLSATLTTYSMEALYDFFGNGRSVHQVHAVRLRPEPIYWHSKAETSAEKSDRIEEALAHLPRPAILYTTQRRDAAHWYERLQCLGYRRLGLVHGGTQTAERSEVIARWNRDEIDLVVATSAFGLGVDKADVRTVLHATCPEGIDRLYQEAGRGGRDGFASVALMVWTMRDEDLARDLARPTFIGAGRGYQRWMAMFDSGHRHVLGDACFALPLDETPSMNPEDIDMQSDANERWNLRTTLLMQRAGLLQLEGQSFDGERRRIEVRIKEPRHADRAFWEDHVVEARKALLDETRIGWSLLAEALAPGKRCIAEILDQAYTCDAHGVSVVRACGGCPGCRAAGRPPTSGRMIPRHTPNEPFPSTPIEDGLGRLLGSELRAVLFCEEGTDDPGPLTELAAWLVQQGIRQLVLPDEWRLRWEPELAAGRPIFCDRSPPGGVIGRLPMAMFVFSSLRPSWPDLWRQVQARGPGEGALVLVLPHDLPQPGRPTREMRDILPWPAHYTISQWREGYLE